MHGKQNGKIISHAVRYSNVFKMESKYQKINLIRKSECIINRLRLMQTRLNADLFKIGLHADGLCSTCGVLQDCTHFILDCQDSENLRSNIKKSYTVSKPWKYDNLLSDPGVINIIIKYVTTNNILI